MRRRPRRAPAPDGRWRLDLTSQQWVVAFLIGTATVLAALFGWRAAAIGSTAAFDDRQSISQTVTTEQQRIDVGLGVDADSRGYARYLTGYGVAAELDNQAASLQANGEGAAAAAYRREADALRRTATAGAVAAGVFGRYGIQDDLQRAGPTPRPFDAGERARALQVELTTAVDSPGALDPDDPAGQAEAIRDRILGLAGWSLVVVVALLLFTVGQVNSGRRVVFSIAMGLGLVVLLVGAIGGFATDFHA